MNTQTDGGIDYELSDNGIATLTFGRAGPRPVMLTTTVMQGLSRRLEQIAADSAVRLLVIKSAMPDIFIAGADLREIETLTSPADAREKSSQGQAVLDRLASLPIPTVAVIDGACLGGGLELALSCAFRVVSDNHKTVLGLPETGLGLLPGFGGTVRLPRLVGLQKGLSMILGAKKVDGPEAFKIGLADVCSPQAFLDDRTDAFLRQLLDPAERRRILAKRRRRGGLAENNPLGRLLIRQAVKREVLKRTHGFYPAPLLALRTVMANFGRRTDRGLEAESQAFASLATGDIARKLIRLFFRSEELKKASPASAADSTDLPPVRSVAVVGAGKMGGGIAWLFSQAGIPVRLKDVSWPAVMAGLQSIAGLYHELEARGRLDQRRIVLGMHKISGTLDYSGFGTVDLVVEAIVEDLEAKRQLFRELEERLPPTTIIATNTSSLAVADLAKGLRHPERLVGFHFFNPVNRMPLIEVVRGPATAPSVSHRMASLALALNKTPIAVKDCNGFLVNRILMAYLNEAILLLEEGCDPVAVDNRALAFGLPMGPFALLDEIGIPVGWKVFKILAEAYPDRVEAGRLFQKLGARPDLIGRSTGVGFYRYAKGGKTVNPAILALRDAGNAPPPDNQEITDRLLLRMLNEASHCLAEGIVDSPAHLDMALILGIGFPPFRGGLLEFADDTGIAGVVARLQDLCERTGKRFEPAALLREKLAAGSGFYR